jgi:hypothetical protein
MVLAGVVLIYQQHRKKTIKKLSVQHKLAIIRIVYMSRDYFHNLHTRTHAHTHTHTYIYIYIHIYIYIYIYIYTHMYMYIYT